ncbi:MAG: Omp28-related outer membrane protein, partial [Flavobacteriales bacterium]|nr:Omp28-related outer membrane protein [Flavobacteriales bacterium]
EIDFGISITSEMNEDEGNITINTELLNDVIGDYNLVACLTESHIINWQKDGQIENAFYEHNHALRSVLIDKNLSTSSSYSSGDEIIEPIIINLTTLEQYNIDYSVNTAINGSGNAGGWNAENMSVIAYIYDNTTKEIVQVEEAHLNE